MCGAIFLFKSNFVAAILDFGDHIGFYQYMNHTYLKLDIDVLLCKLLGLSYDIHRRKRNFS